MSVNIAVRWADNTKDLKAALQEGTDAIYATKAATDKLVQAFSGDKLIEAAHRMVAAIGEVGGAEKLTNAERDRTNALLDKAIQKYAALGKEAPSAMRALFAETQKVTTATSAMVDGMSAASKQSLSSITLIGGMSQAGHDAAAVVNKEIVPATKNWASALSGVSGLLSTLGVGVSAGAVVGLMKTVMSAAIDTAGALTDLSNKTGLSTETLQRMQFVAKQSGTDMTVFADAAFKLGVNLSEGTTKARDAAKDLGLDWKALRAASPDQQFDMVVRALEAMEDPQKRNAAAVALFGKTAKEIMPAVVDGYTKIAQAARVTGDAQIKAIDAANDAWDRWKTARTSDVMSVVGGFLLYREAVNTLTDAEKKLAIESDKTGKSLHDLFINALLAKRAANVDIPLPAPPKAPSESFAADLKKAEAGYRALTAAQKANLEAAFKLGTQDDKIIDSLDITADVLAVAKKAYDEHKSAISKAAAAAEDWAKVLVDVESAGEDFHKTILGIDGAIVPWAEHLLKSGVSAQAVAKYYGLTDTQVKALTEDIKAEGEAIKVLLEIREKWEAGTTKLNDVLMQSNSTELITIKQHLDLAAAMHMVEQSIPPTVDGFYGAATGLENLGLKSTELRDLQIKLALQTKSLGQVFEDTFKQLPGIMEKAFEGGGGAEGAAKAFGAVLADNLIKGYEDRIKKSGGTISARQQTAVNAGTAAGGALGGGFGGPTGALIGSTAASIGGAALIAGGAFGGAAAGVGGAIALGATTAGIGAAAVGVYLLAKHFLTVSQNEKDARVEFAKLQDLYGSLPDTIKGVGDAYALMGYSGERAQADLKRALDASHDSAQAEDAALRPILEVLAAAAKRTEELEAKTAEVATGLDDLTAAGQAFGGHVPDQFKAAVRELANMKGVTDDERKALLALAADVKPNFEELTKTAEKYGITLEGLGKSFQQANIEGRAKDITDDFEALTKAGGDAGGILVGMSDEISKLVTDSKKFGTAIPENMRPLIDELLRAGKLTDENGDKLEDLSGISFEATPIDDSMTKLKDAIDKLRESLEGLAKLQIPPIQVPVTYVAGSGPPGPPPADLPEPVAYATGSGGFKDFGTGTLAVLHGREAVITEAQALRSDYSVTSAASSPAAAGDVHVHFSISTLDATDFQTVVEQKVFPAIVNQLRRGRGLTAMKDVLG